MQNKKEFLCSLAVLSAGTMWGFMGLFSRYFGTAGVNSAGVILLRCGVAAVLFFVVLAIRDRAMLKIRIRDLWCFLGTGLCSMLFFTYCYFRAIDMMSMSAAAILLYTAPFFVVLLSAFFFHETLTKRKLMAMALGFMGCCFVSGVGSETHVTANGLLFGLGAGVGYALYSIFAKFALEKGYHQLTVNLYTHSFAAVGAAIIWGWEVPISVAVSSPMLILVTLGLGVFTCFLPYLLYTYSLTGMEAGKASIIANVEPVVATVLGLIIYHEKLTLGNLLGISLVLAAVIMLSQKKGSQ